MAIKGLNQTIAEIRKFGGDVEKKIAEKTEGIAFQIADDAATKAPKNFGKLAQSITYAKINETNYKITVNEIYGAYVEFGTGLKATNIPPEFRDMAATFKGPTGRSFEDGVESIREWLNAKGGNPDDAKWVLLNILMNGMRAQPYLYPAWKKGTIDYLNNLKKLLKKLNKKI